MKQLQRRHLTFEVGLLSGPTSERLVVYDPLAQPVKNATAFVALFDVAEGRMLYLRKSDARAALSTANDDVATQSAVDAYCAYAKLEPQADWLESQRTDAGLRLGVTTHAALQKTHPQGEISYESLLSTVEWLDRRAAILSRDKHRCLTCSSTIAPDGRALTLQVHHTYYVLDWLPWEYPDDALKTLCLQCHQDLHRAGRVPILEFVDGRLTPTSFRACFRCMGAGFFPQYMHIEEGVCFRCRGTRFEEKWASKWL